MKVGVIVDTSENILNTIDSLTETVLYALLFVVLVVFLFLGRWRATLIIGITIPISLIASFIYLAISGNTINIISLSSLSIAIGMVVDDAIVVLENVTTHIEKGSDPKQAAVHGTNEVAISVVASTLTMIAVFFPLTMVGGMSGIMFRQLGWMMCAIMFVSTVSALTLTPMLCSQLLRLQRKQSKVFKLLFGPIEKGLDALDNGYINRGITGAIVNRQPFGGMKLSAFGGGIKAGGPNYCTCFVTITDKAGSKTDYIKSYEDAYNSEFSKARDVNNLYGEQNLFRYLPVKNMALRLFQYDNLEYAKMIAKAAKLCKLALTISMDP